MSVSVLIPTHNRLNSFKRAIQSVFDQTYPVDEIIVTDSGSDGTAEYVQALDDPRIVYSKNTYGMVDNWKAALDKASGQWIKFVFDDDWLESTCIERLLVNTDVHTEISQCGGWFEPLGVPCYSQFKEDWDIPSSVRQGILSVSPVTAIHRKMYLQWVFGKFDQLSPSCIESGVGPNVLMNYAGVWLKDGTAWHRHIPDLLVHLGGDDLPGEQRSTTSRLWAENPELIYNNYQEAYALMDKLAGR